MKKTLLRDSKDLVRRLVENGFILVSRARFAP